MNRPDRQALPRTFSILMIVTTLRWCLRSPTASPCSITAMCLPAGTTADSRRTSSCSPEKVYLRVRLISILRNVNAYYGDSPLLYGVPRSP